MGYSLNSLAASYIGDYVGKYSSISIGVIQGDTGSFDYSSNSTVPSFSTNHQQVDRSLVASCPSGPRHSPTVV